LPIVSLVKPPEHLSLLRRLTVIDLTLITIGAIVGSGIFRNPSVVAQRVHIPWLILGTWVAGGLIAVLGAFIFAELGTRRPEDGGLYAYLRDAFHPVIAFMFGWTTLLIADTSGTAAAAITFAGYIAPSFDPRIVSIGTIAVVTAINCLGVRQGGTWQNVLVLLKVLAIAGVIVAGFVAHPLAVAAQAGAPFAQSAPMLAAFGVAMIPVLFAYNGFQSVSYITGETRDPGRTLPRGLLLGVAAVVIVYVLVNIACLRVLGPAGLAASTAPASAVVQAILGPVGANLIAIAVALSTLGFMSTKMLLTPRIYFQMAADGTFFKQIAWVHPKTRVPVVAIVLQGAFASIIACLGSFEQILNWSIVEYVFVVLAAIALFVFRARDREKPAPAIRVPGHPWSTILFIAAIAGVFVSEGIAFPHDILVGTAIAMLGAAVFFAWRAIATGARSGQTS
jgi:APA family basic amino acid/polyamine antiporter